MSNVRGQQNERARVFCVAANCFCSPREFCCVDFGSAKIIPVHNTIDLADGIRAAIKHFFYRGSGRLWGPGRPESRDCFDEKTKTANVSDFRAQIFPAAGTFRL